MKNTVMKFSKKFIGLTATCGFMVILLSCSHQPTIEENAAASIVKKPEWLKGPIVRKGSNQEPLMFQLRRGGVSLQLEEKYMNSHSGENIKKIKESGGTLFVSHFYKGFGLEAERPEIELAKKLSPLLHENGMKMATYVGSTFGYETFLVEKPESEEWLVSAYLGKPVTYGEQYFRRRAYFGHPGYREYIKKVLTIAIKEVGTDLIHFDNPANQGVAAVFHHPMAIADFREYLKNKYTPERLKERIGFSDVSRIVPPAFSNPEEFQTFDDPITQEWIDFRCQKLADYYKEMAGHIRSLNPEVAVEINPHGITGANRAWESSVDWPRLLANTDVFCLDVNPSSVTKIENGVLESYIRSYKMARTFKNIVFGSVGGSPVLAAESMTYNPYALSPGSDSIQEYVKFYHSQFEHYGNTESVADVAILRTFPSMAYSNYSTHQSTILFEQVLIQCKIPFDIIFDDNLKDLSKYKALILANQECLRDDQLELIREFVRQGGGLIATENSSLYDDWRREREAFGLKDLFGVERPSSIKIMRIQDGGALESIQAIESRQSGTTIKNKFGKGKVAYIPSIEPSIIRPPTEEMLSKYWKLPLNYLEMADAVKWAAGNDLSIVVEAPLTVTMELTEQEDKDKMMLHLINYNVWREKLVRNIGVSLKIPQGKQVKELQLLSPEWDGSESVPFTVREGRVDFTVPHLATYDLVVIKLN